MSKIDVSTDRPQGAESDHLRDATKMVATINEMETVEPVAYSYTDARGRTVLVSTNTAPYEDAKPLYTAPPKREACANLCEEHWRNNGNAMECADAIRARGKK